MASFFGKAATTTTTVKPNPRVTAMLKDILKRSEEIDDFDFISHQAATYTPEGKQAISNLADSGNLRAISGALAPRATQAIEQATKLNESYESTLNNPISVDQVLNQSNAMRNGLYRTVQATAGNAGGVASRLGSAAGRAAARRGTSQMQAAGKLDNRFTNLAINQADQNRKNALDVASMQGNISNTNLNLGMKGIDLGAQATQNQLTAGNIMQGYQNALFQNQQANEQGSNNFIWQKLANKQNIGAQVSNMAGYTIKEKGNGVSQGRQLLGAGIAGLGAMAQQGYLGNFNQSTNAWNSYNNNGGQSGVAGPMPSGSVYDNLSQSQQQQPSMWANAWNGVSGALAGMGGS